MGPCSTEKGNLRSIRHMLQTPLMFPLLLFGVQMVLCLFSFQDWLADSSVWNAQSEEDYKPICLIRWFFLKNGIHEFEWSPNVTILSLPASSFHKNWIPRSDLLKVTWTVEEPSYSCDVPLHCSPVVIYLIVSKATVFCSFCIRDNVLTE